MGGNKAPSAADVEKVLKEAGTKPDSTKVKAVCDACKGKEFHTLVAEGMKAMSAMGGSAAPASSAAPAKGAKKEEPKKEEPKEEEADIDMGDLFGGFWATRALVQSSRKFRRSQYD